MKRKKVNPAIIVTIFIITFILSGFHSGLFPQEKEKKRKIPAKKHYRVTAAASKIKVDGILNEEAWQKALKITTFYEWAPGDNVKPPVDTEVLVTYNKSHFYVAFRCFDPEPGKIRAHLMDRDAIATFIQDDHIVFTIDTFNDELRSFQFRANPLGVQADANFSEIEGYEDFSWDVIWKSVGKITDFGYVLEAAVPFNQLRFPKTKGEQTWGFSAARSYPRSVRYRMSTNPRDRSNSCLFCQYDKITGLAGISPGKNIELAPTLTVNRTDQRQDFPAGEMEAGKIKVEPGITARWGVTPNLMLNATANPDFSHVEADVAQLEVNTRFALYYPEKRPFFLEGADFFLTPFEAVFTRTVVDPLWGVKTTGKIGKNAIGIFAAQDRYNNLLFPANQGSAAASMDTNVFGGVLRYRRDVGKGSTLGLLYTGRVGEGYFNHVAGVDGFIRLSKKKTAKFQFLQSETEYPAEISRDFGQKSGSFSGRAISAEFLHFGRDWYYGANYRDKSPGFRADYGFINRVDTRVLGGFWGRRIWGKKGDWFNELGFNIMGSRTTDCDGNLTDQEIGFAANYSGPMQSAVHPYFSFQKEFYNGVLYNKKQFFSIIEIKPVGGLRLSQYTTIGDAVDYANSRLADSLSLVASTEFALGKHLNVSLAHTYQRLSLKGEKIYTANLFQSRLVYNFNVKSFVRAILQYRDIDRNTALYNFVTDARTNTLFSQFLFSYKINPQTLLFIGYSDDYLGLPGIDITQTNRTFFLKIGYALVR